MKIPLRRDSRGVAQLADALASSRLLRGAIACRRYVPGSPSRHASLRRPLPDPVRRGLEALGASRLYRHQADAIAHVRSGRQVVVVTPTASGKSAVYLAPTLERCAVPGTRALYLFPYKALAQDQLRAFEAFSRASGMEPTPTAAVYDGDTPQSARRRIRSRPPEVLITNPDMLHLGILAHHREWSRFLSSLELVVVDELHVYRGVFGSHLHHVMARLRRLCRHYGSKPLSIACSATIGNPGEFADALLGGPFEVVERSGAPRAGRHFLFVNAADASPYTLATRLMAECLRGEWRTITFAKARKITELIQSWLNQSHPGVAGKVSAYRAGYLPEERREIETRLGDGSLLGVVTTSALEHGIDIGGLDVCILVGYPGSITSSWQRIGRVGRSDRESLVILIGLQDALDQYFMANPSEFFDRGFEAVAADPENPVVASQHLVCAAAELPLTPEDRGIYPDSTFGLVGELTRTGALVADHEEEAWYSLRRRPERDVNLRSTGEGYDIVEEPRGRTVGSVDGVRAFVECHEGAIYLHQGQQFEVIRLDRERRRVEVRRCEVAYYTQVRSEKETEILKVLEERGEPGFVVRLGELRVTQEFKEYVRRQISDQRRLSSHPLDLPPIRYETVGMWIEIPGSFREELATLGRHFMGSLHGTEHAAITLFPLLAICDRGDLGGISYPHHPQVDGPSIFIYDGFPGGIGLARKGYELTCELLQRTSRLIEKCPCEEGCPSCIHSPRCGSGNHPLDKEGCVDLLDRLLRPPKTLGRPVPATIRPFPPPLREAAGPGLAGAPPGSGTPQRPEPRSTGPSPAACAPPAGGRTLFLDLETQRSAEEVGGWDRIREMGLALAVVYDSERGEYQTYFEDQVDRLAVRLLSADLVVGFNVKRFDYEVLRAYTDADFSKIPTLDMLEEIHRRLGFRLSLGHLATATLGVSKSGDGLQSLRWFREGRLDLVEKYCVKDVEITRDLYEMGRKRGYLIYEDRNKRPVRLPVSWRDDSA
jgi:DEAD/DEAH box helicase domain-containing protein